MSENNLNFFTVERYEALINETSGDSDFEGFAGCLIDYSQNLCTEVLLKMGYLDCRTHPLECEFVGMNYEEFLGPMDHTLVFSLAEITNIADEIFLEIVQENAISPTDILDFNFLTNWIVERCKCVSALYMGDVEATPDFYKSQLSVLESQRDSANKKSLEKRRKNRGDKVTVVKKWWDHYLSEGREKQDIVQLIHRKTKIAIPTIYKYLR